MWKSGIKTPGLARRYWQMSSVRGIVLILSGLLATFWPHLTLKLFFFLSGLFAISEGVVLLISAFARRTSMQRGLYAQSHARYYAHQSGPAQGSIAAGQSGPVYHIPTIHKNWTMLLIEGILTVICGLLCLILPALAAVLAVYAIAAWVMFKGITTLTQIAQRGRIMGLIGGLAILLSLVLLLNPPGAIRAFLWSIGLLALIIGILLITRDIRHKAAAHTAPPHERSS
jgi:uncharacterized membrane protein HdeD (DUF308 family)